MPTEIRRQSMTIDEYHLLPFHPGWKVEYLDGEAVFWPREICAYGTRPIQSLPGHPIRDATIRTLDAADAPALTELFNTAFADTPEYAGWPDDSFDREAEKVVRDFFARKRGAPLTASHLAIRQTTGPDDETVIGAAFVVEQGAGSALLDILMVAPAWQHRGVATALVAAALSELAAAGRERFISRWHLANEASVAWHRKLGFVEEPDLFTSQLYLRAASQELRRLEKLGTLIESQRATLRATREHWQREVARLQTLLDTGDARAAFACFRFQD